MPQEALSTWWPIRRSPLRETRRIVSQTRPVRRPALVTFAAILLIMLAGFQLIVAITEFFHYAFGTLPPLVGNVQHPLGPP